MNSSRLLAYCCGFLFAMAATLGLAIDDRPNIVVLFADDMGSSDVGCYGSEIETPNIDRPRVETRSLIGSIIIRHDRKYRTFPDRSPPLWGADERK